MNGRFAFVACGWVEAVLRSATRRHGRPADPRMMRRSSGRGSVGLELHAGEEWLRVRILNAGDAPIDVAWDEAMYLFPRPGANRVIIDAKLGAYVMDLQRARIEAVGFEPEPGRSSYSDRLPHGAPAVLGPAACARIAAGRTATWTLYPAEHVRIDGFGVVKLEPLACGDLAGMPPYITVVVPVNVDGHWTSLVATARLEPESVRAGRTSQAGSNIFRRLHGPRRFRPKALSPLERDAFS